MSESKLASFLCDIKVPTHSKSYSVPQERSVHPPVDTQEQNMPETEWVSPMSGRTMRPLLSLIYTGPFQVGSCIEPALTEAKKTVPVIWEVKVRNTEKNK